MSDKKHSCSIDHGTCRLKAAALTIGQQPYNKDLVGGKQSQGVEVAFAPALFVQIIMIDANTGMVGCKGSNAVQGRVVRLRRYPKIDRRAILTVNSPWRLPVDLLAEILAFEVGYAEVVADGDRVLPGSVNMKRGEFRIKGGVVNRQIAFDTNSDVGDLEVTAMVHLPLILEALVFAGNFAEVFNGG